MKQEEIIQKLKDTYPRDIRKQVVKSIISGEKSKDDLKQTYKIINQIFSFVLHESNWDISKNSKDWDVKPLEIMLEIFPKIQTTLWYKEQIIVSNKSINLVNNIS